jgi:hypothetical protein
MPILGLPKRFTLANWIITMSGMTAGTIQQAKVELNCDMQSLIPALCQDVYHYMDLIDAVRNPTFNLPMMMPYGRFRFLLEQLAEKQHCQTFLSLDPKLPLSPGNRRMLCLSGDSSLLEELSGRLILTLDMSTDTYLHCASGIQVSRTVSLQTSISCFRYSLGLNSPSRIALSA